MIFTGRWRTPGRRGLGASGATLCRSVLALSVGLTSWVLAGPPRPAPDRPLPLQVTYAGLPGPYTLEQWKAEWPGCEFEDGVREGRLLVVNGGASNWLRVQFAVGGIGPQQGGAGWRWPFGNKEAAELRYAVCFSPGFDFVKGGKLPGLCGGPKNVSGGRPANGTNGFSARLMWRKDGKGEAYVYHKNQKDDYGDRFAFPEDFRFPTGVPVQVRLAVAMNAPGQRNGSLRVWITLPGQAERAVVQCMDLEWRSVDRFGVDSLYFETFHGGNDSSWAPSRPCWAEFSPMEVVNPGAP